MTLGTIHGANMGSTWGTQPVTPWYHKSFPSSRFYSTGVTTHNKTGVTTHNKTGVTTHNKTDQVYSIYELSRLQYQDVC